MHLQERHFKVAELRMHLGRLVPGRRGGGEAGGEAGGGEVAESVWVMATVVLGSNVSFQWSTMR